MKKTNDYWYQREKAWIQQQMKDDALVAKKIQLELNRALVAVQKDVTSFYANYAKSQNISLADAMAKVSKFDVKAFEVTAKQMVESKDFSALANERLKLYNATMRINQLEQLKSQIGLELAESNSKIEQMMGEKLSEAYRDEVKRQAGILGKHRLNDVKGAVNSVVNASFQGATWSQRIWANNDQLKSRLDQLLTRSLVQGINPNVLARELSDQFKREFNNSRYMAERLMRTETARVQDEAQRRSFEKNGIEYVMWVAEPDACENCIDIANANDGIYPLAKAPGIPVHANCRCSKAAYVPNKTERPS
ncbi:minor capsid protein [Latilactobacillus fuchuensis]|uniref:minor capsid protein n=1 Tax=Latilactobacillus fuchuensis TaxID=164393 RepID=UPI0039AEEDDD